MPDVIINGPEGRIEGRYHHARGPNCADGAGAAPASAARRDDEQQARLHALPVFVRHGFSTLRFNFRGVGRSQGSFDRGEGELSDAASALDWLQTYNPNAGTCWVAGFSFGAWIGMQLLMRRPEIESFIAVAPPANVYDFTLSRAVPVIGADPARRPGHAGAGRLGAEARHKLSHQRDIKIDFRKIPGADHYLRRSARHDRQPCRRLYPRPSAPRRQARHDAARPWRQVAGSAVNPRTGRAPAPCRRARGWSRAAPPARRSALRAGGCT